MPLLAMPVYLCKGTNNRKKIQIIGLELSFNALDLLINVIDLTIAGADSTLPNASRPFTRVTSAL